MLMKRKLFTPYILASLELKNRFVMAPMTRARSSQPGDVPNALMARYYAQRSSAGLIITGSAQVSLQGKAYMRSPGMYTQAQLGGWKQIAQAVHARGSRIYLQLCHAGAMSSSKVNGLQPIAPSAIQADAQVYMFEENSNKPIFVPTEKPREMTLDDIEQVIQDFVRSARCAIEAGFDGVEIHAANGYLLDQFLRKTSNFRTDVYGGSAENRVRFLVRLVREVAQAIGADQIGVRLSPYLQAKQTEDSSMLETVLLAAQRLDELRVGYLHLVEPAWKEAPTITDDFRKELRRAFSRTIIVTGNKTPEMAEELLEKGRVDLVGFGRAFVANPDYPRRVLDGAYLNIIENSESLCGGEREKGYTDYPYWKGEP